MVATLFVHPIGDDTYSYRCWIRHATIQAARSGVLVSDAGEQLRGAIIGFARAVVPRVPALHDDVLDGDHVVVLGGAPEPDDTVLDSLCQADYLWCVVAASQPGVTNPGREAYPSCASYFDHRTQPMADLLAGDSRVRAAAIGQPDATIADAMAHVNAAGEREGWDSAWSLEPDERRALPRRSRRHAR